MRKWIILLLLSLSLSGCLLGPNYRLPENQVSDAWNTEVSPCEDLDPPTAWWTLFNDPLLDHYIEQSVHYNNNLLIAEVSINKAISIRNVTRAAFFPQVNAELAALRVYFSKNSPLLGFGIGNSNSETDQNFENNFPRLQNLFGAVLTASWEIDLFGKTRRAVESADAQIGNMIAQRDDALLTIFAQIAQNYMELRSHQEMGMLIEENIEFLESNVSLVRTRLEVGYVSRLDLERVEAELARARAMLPDIYAQICQNIYALSVLIGSPPETLLCELLPIQPLPLPPETVALGLRSDLLRRRPDIRSAERQLAVATANIGVAVASFFPSFTLGGDLGFQSFSLANLFQASSLEWALGGNVHIPVFRGGSLVGRLRLAEATAIAAAYNYQQTILTALQEAESALCAYTQEVKTLSLLGEAANKYFDLVSLTQERYRSGVIGLLDLLDIERQWNAAEQSLLNTKVSLLLNVINLYRALGGGWECECEI